MSREKRIKEMSQDLSECIDYDEWAAREYGETYVDYDSTAFNMVGRGWCKRGDVIDEFAERLKEAPIKCALPLLGLSTKGEIEEHFNGIMLQVRDAIDGIAKEMKGGAE